MFLRKMFAQKVYCNSFTLRCSPVNFLYDLANDFFENTLRRLLLCKNYLFFLHWITLHWVTVSIPRKTVITRSDYVKMCYTRSSFEKWSLLEIDFQPYLKREYGEKFFATILLLMSYPSTNSSLVPDWHSWQNDLAQQLSCWPCATIKFDEERMKFFVSQIFHMTFC